MIRKRQIRNRCRLRHVARRTIRRSGACASSLPCMTPFTGLVVTHRGRHARMWIVATHTSQLPPTFQIAAAHHQTHRSKPHTHRVFHLRHRRRIFPRRRAMTGRTSRNTRISPYRLRHRMPALHSVAVLTMHSRPLASHMTPKTPRRILWRLHHPHRPLKILRRLQRMSRRQTQLPRRRIPAQSLLHPSLAILENRRPRKVPSPKQPRESEHPLHAILHNLYTRVIK